MMLPLFVNSTGLIVCVHGHSRCINRNICEKGGGGGYGGGGGGGI